MKREDMISHLKHSPDIWDIIIIGGGATGLGSAVDAASRGYKTLLIEQHDFAKATSSRSTKLIHGGLRYLKQGNISLVAEALKERGLLCQNAPHLVNHLAFLVPSYHWWEGPFYGVGLKIYDMLAGKLGIEKSQMLSREEALQKIPNLQSDGLKGATLYYDGQFDDSRLAITLAKTFHDLGGTLVNYFKVTNLVKSNDLVNGVEAVDEETKEKYILHAKVVINAAGIFSDSIRKMDDKKISPLIDASQGVHLVFSKNFLNSDTAVLVPHTDDGRVLFVVPWHNHVLVGTTDTGGQKPVLEPTPHEEEIDFLLRHAAIYLKKAPQRKDILSMFAGLRPLVKSGKKSTASLSRDHVIVVSESGLISICGGKWTTYRRMAQDVIDKAAIIGNLKEYSSATDKLHLHGYTQDGARIDAWGLYGSDAQKLYNLTIASPELGKPFHPDLPYLPVEVVWAVREEMARTVEDVLARRTRALFLNAKASMAIAPSVAKIMAKELKENTAWEKEQVEIFSKLAKDYLPTI